MKIFVTGGTGFVGSCFIEYVLKYHPEYTTIIALSRSAAGDQTILNAAGAQRSQVQIARGDLTSVSNLEKEMKDCAIVFHIAAKVDIWGKWEDFVEVNVNGTKNMVTAAKAAGVKRFVHVSTEAVLVSGVGNGCLINVDETAPVSLTPPFYAPYTASKAMAEQVVLEGNDVAHNFATVIVRPRLVWGKGDTKVIPEIEKAIQQGIFKWFTPEVQTSTCHVDNLCEGMILAAQKGSPGDVYFLVDGEGTIVFNDLVRKLLGESIDLSQVGSVSSWLVWYVAVFLENIPFAGFGVTREPPLNRQVLALLTQDAIINDSKARRELGYTSHKTRDEGIKEYIAWRKETKST